MDTSSLTMCSEPFRTRPRGYAKRMLVLVCKVPAQTFPRPVFSPSSVPVGDHSTQNDRLLVLKEEPLPTSRTYVYVCVCVCVGLRSLQDPCSPRAM